MPDAYFCWLTGFIGNDYIEGNYQKLLWKLFSTEYYYELMYDRNRAADGVYLRKLFIREFNFGAPDIESFESNKPCTVLEMLIALARKIEDDLMHDSDIGDRTGEWFWLMLVNLGLDIYDDVRYLESGVVYHLQIFLHHLYAPNGGAGGIFSVRRSDIDMTKTDLWLQANVYFEENFPVPIW